jgi:hypothetical protein
VIVCHKMNKYFLIGTILVLGILIGVQQLFFPHVFEPICWLSQDQYAQTIHIVSLGGESSDGQINLIATSSAANIYYCARFGAGYPVGPIPDQSPMSVPLLEPPPPEGISQGTIVNNSVEIPVDMTISTSSTIFRVSGFSFSLPLSWDATESIPYSDVYRLDFSQGSTSPGFFIECPPVGKDIDGVSSLYSENRKFVDGGITYRILLTKDNQPGTQNPPWYWIFIDPNIPEQQGNDCLVQAEGGITPEITKAMQSIYDSWK